MANRGELWIERVREGCAWVAQRASSVSIVGDPLDYGREVLERSPAGSLEVEWDEETHYRGGPAETVAFVVTLDAINFGSGYFPHLQKRPGRSGYFTVALSLKERFDRAGPLSAQELRDLSRGDVKRLFGQPDGDEVRDELMHHFTRALNDLGEFLHTRFGGSFVELLEAADRSALRLVALLLEMPYFRDISEYAGREIPLLKRAQITPSDLALALPDTQLTEFDDLDELTIFADNLVPHVLRLDGMLEYSPELAARLERGELLPAGSAEEVEIRAVALHFVEQMVAALVADGTPITARELDLVLWNRGQAQRYRGGSKHRTRTVYY